MTQVVRRVLISGVVQGVGFRYSMLAQARLLGITGWVRNCRDSRVEAVIAGDAAQVEAMLAWSRIGPAGSSVAELIAEPATGEFHDFELRPTV
ncbi:MAG: acylphosphatase [Sulfuritalea sp.]|jgi:acylphosphatase|nr:acylphosphatase [Sulfuritalea sp.]